ncbi:MAG TPA: hypothetical protein VLB84_12270, partial [Bacteroidia bacterium]|nr:hypothetical protein [Bacteroidia bacterium]
MKAGFSILISLGCIFLMHCSTQEKIAYELPDAMIASARIEYAKQCDKGKILYDINCAKCHNSKERRREIIPDFTAEQLVGYELRV